MELTVLRYFVMVAKELHFRRAAEKLHITQAPLSTAIRKLEDELGVSLFERTSRSVKLSPAGRVFLPEAEAVLKRLNTALQHLEDFRNGGQGHLVIGYTESALNTVLPEFLAGCRQKQPDLHLELRELETSEQLQQLRESLLDIGFMRPYGFDLTGLESRPVYQEEYRLVMPKTHPVARFRMVRVSHLSGQNVILFAREVNPTVFDLLSASLTDPGKSPPKFRQDARSKSSMLALVKAGFGIALLPESSTHHLPDDLVTRRISVPLPSVVLLAVWNPANTNASTLSYMQRQKSFETDRLEKTCRNVKL